MASSPDDSGRPALSGAPATDPLDAYDYALPPEQIAQQPTPRRDGARLFALDRRGRAAPRHAGIPDLPDLLREGDLVVVNATRVLSARLCGRKSTGGRAEALLLGLADTEASPDAPQQFRALVGCRGRLRPGLHFHFEARHQPGDLEAEVVAVTPDGEAILRFSGEGDPYAWGSPPLPPYIRRSPDAPAEDELDRERYQTVFARVPGAVAAPTAGLHLTPDTFAALEARGVERAEVVLHVGAGTFRPVRPENLAAGRLHPEAFELSEETAAAFARTRARGGRVIAVGTTTTRVLESRVDAEGRLRPGHGETDLLLQPGSTFRAVDGLLTNFHLPRSSLLLLVAGFAGRENILAAYAEAIREGYRFYSYGDAMLIL